MPNLLALFLMGSEVRQFGHSGLLSSLLDQGWTVTVAAKIVDEDLLSQIDSRIKLTNLPISSLSFRAGQIQTVLDKANALHLEKLGQLEWYYKRANTPVNIRQRLLFAGQESLASVLSHWAPLYRLAERVEQYAMVREEVPAWHDLFTQTRPDVLLVNIPKTGNLAAAFSVAKDLGTKTVLLYHTWKDVTVASGRLNHAFSLVGVWNQLMFQKLLLQNPTISPENVKVIGCGHFDCVGREDLLLPETEVRASLGLHPRRQIVLYTAAAPWVVPQEEAYVGVLYNGLKSGQLSADVDIVVRANPMDDTGMLYARLEKLYPEIKVMQPSWRWDKRANWCFQRKEDVELYNSVLHYASVNVSIPSTVTIECAIADLPVVNIGFDIPTAQAPMMGSIHSFWDAEFYHDVRIAGAAELATSPSELLVHIRNALGDRRRNSEKRRRLVDAQLGIPPGDSTRVAMEMICTDHHGPTRPL